jgi:radical SAM superfamily enzyme YgiQ (UPF0313 family)
MKDTSGKRYRLLLVNPRRRYRYHWDLYELCRVMGKKTAVHPLALPTVAALTPPHYDVAILDEHVETIRYEPKPDLVGITALGPNVHRAYAIADRFRSLGVPVVMGGPQVSFTAEESLRHADSLVIGEAEEAWPECLADFEQGRLKPTYQRSGPYEFRTMPRPRWDLVNTRGVMALGVQASRGCPYRCDFCLVRNMFGEAQRYRDLDNLMDEIQSLPKRQITFVDDNLTANKPYARELMRRLKPLKVSWMCQASLEVCRDEELLKAMAEAGCTCMLLGIESLNPQSLAEAGKKQNRVDEYRDSIRRVHRQGIHVVGSFIVGFDSDRLDAFEKIYDFTMDNNISLIMLNLLTASPGTPLHARMKQAGRLRALEPEMVNGMYPTMQYRHISQGDIFEKYFETLEKMLRYDAVRKKALEVFGSGNFRRYNDKDIRPRDKLRSLCHLARHFLMTSDREKRRLFADLFALVFQHRVSVGNVVEFLLLIVSFNGFLQYTKEHRVEIQRKIRENDPGPLEREGQDAV